MARLIVEEQPEYSVLPQDSIILVKIEGMEIVELNGNNGPWEKLNLTFKILDVVQPGDGSPSSKYADAVGSKIWGGVPFKLTSSPENKLRLWAEAIFGMELGVGFELDTDLFAGKTVRAVTTTYTNKQGHPRHQVQSLLPYAQSAVGAAPAAAPAATPAVDPWAASSSSFEDEPPF